MTPSEAPVEIVPYDAAWSRLFDEERRALLQTAVLAGVGYCYSPYKQESEHWFCKPSLAFRTHHLHLMPFGSPQWLAPIAFRDYLRSHALVAAEYDDLKRRLAREHHFDREGYTVAKGPFVTRITGLALQDPGS